MATLGTQPGLTITSFARERGRFVIHGLRDPLSPDPMKFVNDAHLDPSQAEFHWGAYYALDDPLIQQRAIRAFAPPPGVSLSVNGGVLHVDGRPSSKWLNDLRSRAPLIPGIRALDFGHSTPEQVAFDEAKNRVQSTLVRFPLASSDLSSAERSNLREVLPSLRELLNAPALSRGAVIIVVVGHSDSTGAESVNQNLSQRRAERIVAQFIQLGIPAGSIQPKGVATAEPVRPEDSEENRQFNRSVTFRVLTSSASQP
jgi:OOP family OmpA-OmpF porin